MTTYQNTMKSTYIDFQKNTGGGFATSAKLTASDNLFTFEGTSSGRCTIAGIRDPTQSHHVATKNYVDSLSQGLDVRASCQVATTADISGTYSNSGSGAGSTLTGQSTGVLTVDGITVTLGMRVLVKDQSTGAENGIYDCTTAGAVGVAYVLTRSTDFDSPADMNPGAFTFVERGTTNEDSGFVLTSDLYSTVLAGTGSINYDSTTLSTSTDHSGTLSANQGIKVGDQYFTIASVSGTTVNTEVKANQTLSSAGIYSGPTVGTTSITFTQFSGAGMITGGVAVNKSGNELYLDMDKPSEQGSVANTYELLVNTTPGSNNVRTMTRSIYLAKGYTMDSAEAINFASTNTSIKGNGTTLTLTGAVAVTGDTNIGSGNFTVAAGSGNTAVAGTLGVTGVGTFTAQSVHSGGIQTGGNIISDTDSTDDLGSSTVRFANVFTDSIGDNGQDLAVAATTLSFDAASTIDTSGNNALTLSAGNANINMTAGTVAMGTNATVGGTLGVTGVGTFTAQSVHSGGIQTGGNIVSDADSTDDLGSSAIRFANVFTDSIGDNGQDLAVAATTLSFDTASTIDTSGNNALTLSAGTANINMTATTVAMGTNATVGGTLGVTGIATFTAQSVHSGGIQTGGTIISDTDSTDNLGSADVRWANVYADSIGDSGQALAVAATTLSFDAASTIDTSGNNALTLSAGTANINMTATTVAMATNATVGGTLGVTGVGTFTAQSVHSGGIQTGGTIISDTDSTDDLGSSTVRWANVYTDSIGDSSQALAVAATTLSFDAASTIDTSGNNALTLSAGSANINLTAGTVAMGTNATVGGTLGVTGVGTFTAQSVHTGGIQTGSNIISDTDSTDDLGSSTVRWANVYTDTIGDNGQDLNVGATTLSFDAASTIDTSGNNALTLSAGNANINMTAGTVAMGTNATVGGTLAVTSDFSVATNNFTVAAATGNTHVEGTLNCDSTFTVNTNKFSVAAATGALTINNGSTSGTVNLGDTSTNVVGDGSNITLTVAAASNKVSTNGYFEGTYFNAVSDERLKKNFRNVSKAMDKINKMQGCYYDWNNTERKKVGLTYSREKNMIGFKAGEIAKIEPSVVQNGKEYRTIDYSRITVLAVEALKELNSKFDKLQQENKNLRKMITV